MAEKFTFHQLRGNCATVDGDKRRLSMRSQIVNEARHQLFAATGFTTDINGSLAAGEFGNLAAQIFHHL